MSAVQLAFFPFRKPLLDLFGAEFFKSIPRAPGVYQFLSERGRVLYVGQSRDLRTRLSYYKNARPDREPRRILRMIARAQAVRFEVCDCAEAAQARELQLIQQHRPTYNRALNGNPLHPYVALDHSGGRAVLRLADAPEESPGEVYGAFRGVGRCRMVLQALGRLFWCCGHPGAGIWDLPLRLGGSSRAREVEAAASGEACALLVDYLAGARNGLTEWFTEHLESADAHLGCLLEHDLLVVTEFFAWGPEWNRRISELHGLPRVIPRAELDGLRLKTRGAVKLARAADGNQSGDLR